MHASAVKAIESRSHCRQHTTNANKRYFLGGKGKGIAISRVWKSQSICLIYNLPKTPNLYTLYNLHPAKLVDTKGEAIPKALVLHMN
jgi:hypothetical protein